VYPRQVAVVERWLAHWQYRRRAYQVRCVLRHHGSQRLIGACSNRHKGVQHGDLCVSATNHNQFTAWRRRRRELWRNSSCVQWRSALYVECTEWAVPAGAIARRVDRAGFGHALTDRSILVLDSGQRFGRPNCFQQFQREHRTCLIPNRQQHFSCFGSDFRWNLGDGQRIKLPCRSDGSVWW